MTSPAPTFSQRLQTPGELGGWKLAINPLAQLFYLYLRSVFAQIDRMMAEFDPAAALVTQPRAARRSAAARLRRSAPAQAQARRPAAAQRPAAARRSRSATPRLALPRQDRQGRNRPRPDQPPLLRRLLR